MLSLYAIFVIFRPLSRIGPQSELIIRESYLRRWYRWVDDFINKNGRMPSSLYEVSWSDRYGPAKVKTKTTYFSQSEIDELIDPNTFSREVEYFFAAHHNGWFIIELEPGEYWKHRLMIDQDGKIYELKEIKQEAESMTRDE
jgi:hypothetical protein